MLIVMKRESSPRDRERVAFLIEDFGFHPRPLRHDGKDCVAVVGLHGEIDAAVFAGLPGVDEVLPFAGPLHRVRREIHPAGSTVRVGPAAFGPGRLSVIAGPCAVESRDQILAIAETVKRAGADVLRGGAFKPRTSPYSFQGLGPEALELLAEARERTGLPVVTEAMDEASLEQVERFADMVQIGARNMQNYALLRRVGRGPLPVLLKRGLSATLEEFLMAAEYVMAEGNENVVLCERGIRAFPTHARYTLDLSIVPAVQRFSHLPIIVDPSHAAGRRRYVPPLARAAVAVGADGVMIETHADPARARCDGPQALRPDELAPLLAELRALGSALGTRAETVS